MTAHGSAPRTDDEPKTPLWLPGLGLVFFVVLAIVWTTLPDAPPPATGSGDEPGDVAKAQPARPAAPTLPQGHP